MGVAPLHETARFDSIEPRQFDAYREYGLSLGFQAVFSGPLVRSSYMAEAVSQEVGRLC